jgi:hypothetical protein
VPTGGRASRLAGFIAGLGLLIAAPSAVADIEHVRTMPVSSPVFTLDPSDDILVARNGAIDRYSSTGTPETGFATAPTFASSNDIAYAGGRVYALSIDSASSASRLYTWQPDGSNELATSTDLSSYLNLARGLDVRGGVAYIGTGETNRLTRVSVSPVLGANMTVAGAGVVSGMNGAFETCVPGPGNPCSSNAFSGTELRHVNNPRDIAIDMNGNTYVANAGFSANAPARIHLFNPDPFPIGTIGSFGSGAGQLNFPHGIVLDDDEENLYVADTNNHRVMQFEIDGTFVQGFGYGVDTGAPQFETCTTASGCQTGISGSAPGQLSSPFKLDLDSSGDLYVSSGGARIDVFSLDGVGPSEKTVGLKADPKRVKKGKSTKLIATLAPCPATVGEPISFERKAGGGWVRIGNPKTANASCKASQTQRVQRNAKFRARSKATPGFEAAVSKTQTVRVK